MTREKVYWKSGSIEPFQVNYSSLPAFSRQTSTKSYVTTIWKPMPETRVQRDPNSGWKWAVCFACFTGLSIVFPSLNSHLSCLKGNFVCDGIVYMIGIMIKPISTVRSAQNPAGKKPTKTLPHSILRHPIQPSLFWDQWATALPSVLGQLSALWSTPMEHESFAFPEHWLPRPEWLLAR